MDPDEIIADALIERSIDIFRLTAGERAKLLTVLKNLEDELVDLLFHSGRKLSDVTRADKAALLRQAQTLINDLYGGAADDFERTLGGLGTLEATATAAMLKEAFASVVAPKLPPETFLSNLLKNTLIDGAPSADWWKRQAGDTAFRFANAVRQGIAAAESNDQIIRRVRGGQGTAGVMDVARHNAAALVQTSVQTVANAARFETFSQNDDVLKGWRQLSTLDSHTTVICVAYAGKEWDNQKRPIGHDLPFVSPKGAPSGTPRHWGCRSIMSVITKTFAELGIDIPEFRPSTRAASGGPVAANTTFEQFIAKKGTAFADDLLGPGRAGMYLDGKITLTQLLDQTGRPLSLAELQKKYG